MCRKRWNHVKYRFLCSVMTLVFLYLSGGCLKMGPDYQRPETGISPPDSYQHTPTESAPFDPENRWWLVFNDQELNRIVEEVLKNNLDIKKATARIFEVRSQVITTRAERFPSISLQGQSQRQRRPETVSVPGYSPDRETDSHNLSLPALLSWIYGVVWPGRKKRLWVISYRQKKIAAPSARPSWPKRSISIFRWNPGSGG